MAEAAKQGDRLNVFISYSRDDLDFADQLDAALKLTGFDTSIDHTIPGGDEWEKRLVTLIRDADTIVFVLSPSSARSKWCDWEVQRAVERGKRILPVLCRSLEGVDPPPQLGRPPIYLLLRGEEKSKFGIRYGVGGPRIGAQYR